MISPVVSDVTFTFDVCCENPGEMDKLIDLMAEGATVVQSKLVAHSMEGV